MEPSTVRVGDEVVTIRELGTDDLVRLSAIPPFDTAGLPRLPNMRVVGAVREHDGMIVAYWMLFDAVHVEPLWIAADYQRKPALGRRLWEGVRKILCEVKVPRAFAMIHNDDAAMNMPMAMRLGFQRLPGDLYFLDTTKMKGNGAGD